MSQLWLLGPRGAYWFTRALGESWTLAFEEPQDPNQQQTEKRSCLVCVICYCPPHVPGLSKVSHVTAVHQGGSGPYLSPTSPEEFLFRAPAAIGARMRVGAWARIQRGCGWCLAWASTFLSGLSPGTLKVLFFILAAVCAWYSGYLLAELIPDVPLSSAADSIRSFGGRLVLTGQYRGSW